MKNCIYKIKIIKINIKLLNVLLVITALVMLAGYSKERTINEAGNLVPQTVEQDLL